MKKMFLLLSLVWCGVIMAEKLSDDEIFLNQVDHITRTREVQKEGGASIEDIIVAVDIAGGDYQEEADKQWWENNPTTACVLSYAAGMGITAFYFLNYR